nr:hypothetical protein [Tanacetum cinerariifolium]
MKYQILYFLPPIVEARIIPGPVGILQKALVQKKAYVQARGRDNILTTQEYVSKVNEDVSEDDHFTQGPWLQAIVYLHGEGVIVSGCLGDIKKHCINGKLKLIVGVVKSCIPNSLGEMTVTLKDPTGLVLLQIQSCPLILLEVDGIANMALLGSILQLVLLGVESRRNVPEWLLRIVNDRVAWNKYPWGSYVWPTLYSQLRNANVRRWGPLDFSKFQSIQVPYHIGRLNLQTTIETQHDVDGLVDHNMPNREKRQQLPRKYLGKKANLSRVNLEGVLEGYNEEDNNVTFLGSQFTGNILFYENMDPAKHMNSWMKLMIRRRPLNANWTVAYTSTISVHPENNQFIILRDPRVIGTLDGSTRLYPSWNDVDW